MAITTYAELQTAITNWSRRADLSTRATEIITLGEARLNRDFRPRSQETDGALVTVADSRYVAIPSGMLEPVALWIVVTEPREKLTQMMPSQLPVSSTSGYPTYWAIDGTNIAFDCPADAVYNLVFRYLKITALSDSATSNYILANYPDLYLWSCLIDAFTYARSPQNVAFFEARYQNSLKQAKAQENQARANVPLRTDMGGERSNIFAG